MFDVTVGEVLRSEEAVLVQFAADKRLGITALRKHLQAVPRQTLLKNAVGSEPPTIAQITVSAYREYERWLNSLVRRFSFRNLSALCDAISGRRSQTKLKNIKGANVSRDVPPPYGFGLDVAKGRDVWGEITVGAAQQVEKLLGAIRREMGERVRHRLESPSRPPLEDVALEKFVRVRIQLAQAEDVLADIVEPVVHIVGLAMSTDLKRIKLVAKTWPDEHGLSLYISPLNEEPSWRGVMASLIRQAEGCERIGIPMLLVMDCALGWPSDMAAAIGTHEAGGPLPAPALDRRQQVSEHVDRTLNFGGSETKEETRWRTERNLFFRRVTEMYTREHIRHSYSRPYGPNGLDIGADKSARTTHQALRILDVIRREAQLDLPVVTTWCGPIIESSVIEVTTVAVRRRPSTDVTHGGGLAQDSSDEDLRQASKQTTPGDLMLSYGAQFLNGKLATPRQVGVSDDLARKEGWIWSIPTFSDQSTAEM